MKNDKGILDQIIEMSHLREKKLLSKFKFFKSIYNDLTEDVFRIYVKAVYAEKPKQKGIFAKLGVKKEDCKWLTADQSRSDLVVGVIDDIHLPFNHKNALKHCAQTFVKNGVEKIFCIGDFIDHHSISRHQTETNADSPLIEHMRVLEEAQKWYEVFPELTLTIGNHDCIPARQAKLLGVPEMYVKDLKEVYEMPEGWSLVNESIYNGVYYFHGIGSGGEHGAKNTAKQLGMSVVQGHIHTSAGVAYIKNPTGKMWFGLSVGASIDDDAYAFAYSRAFKKKSIPGCGIVIDSKEAYFVPLT